jgi:hypothetical protein
MKRFFYREKNDRGEAWYYLGRNTQTGAAYVECKWAARGILGSRRMAVSAFLRSPSQPARNSLLRLIGRLKEEAGDAQRLQPRRRRQNLN